MFAILLSIASCVVGQTYTPLLEGQPNYFPYKNDFYYISVPTGISGQIYLYVYMWGAGGAGNQANGGAGAYVEGALEVFPDQKLVVVTGGGGPVHAGNIAFGGGGSGTYYGSDGGGRSAIQDANENDLVTAGGGGGSYGYQGGSSTSYSGNVIQLTAFAGASNVMTTSASTGGGGGGNITFGGRAGTSPYGPCSAGNKYQGGIGNGNCACGGGGGYYGGGSGFGAAGGGSSYLGNLQKLFKLSKYEYQCACL